MVNKFILMSTSSLFSYLHFYMSSVIVWRLIALIPVGIIWDLVSIERVYLNKEVCTC
jgi:hypothetical protein